MIKFSVITVCLNAGEDLFYTVHNILEQKYDQYELIVKDGYSNDGSVEKLPLNSHLRFIQSKDISVYDAMNQAIDAAQGEYCIFINAGDGLYEDITLAKINEFIETHKGDFYYGKSYTISSGVTNYGPAHVDDFFCYRTTMCHQAMVIKTEYLKKRGYQTCYQVAADREWMVYAYMTAKMKFVRMPITVSNYKGGGISYGNDVLSKIREENKKIRCSYFSKTQRFKYNIRYALTLPGVRSWISRNPKLKKLYYKFRYQYLSRG